ncbi:hypothetical protein [Yinghuangia sp. YIM S09857]|uniref:hypothetical protein n=1 Tax=Yinghuangia sp. YIM S09857 TaxID=3436929 RepID=UPI003F53CD0A
MGGAENEVVPLGAPVWTRTASPSGYPLGRPYGPDLDWGVDGSVPAAVLDPFRRGVAASCESDSLTSLTEVLKQ